jgi:hypothetical protein
MPNVGEDGLLPTKLFERVFISYADYFVMFEPRWEKGGSIKR